MLGKDVERSLKKDKIMKKQLKNLNREDNNEFMI